MTASEPAIGSKRLRREDPTDPPAECEFGDCTEPPTHRVRYADPTDHVYYCREHKAYTRNFDGWKLCRDL